MTRAWMTLLAALIAVSGFAAEVPIPAPPQVGARSFLLMDFASDRVLAEAAADEPVEPASLTKLMTAYAVFRALDDGQISMSDRVRVSEKAWRTPGSRMFIEVNSEVGVEDLIRGMIVQSGNDASVALAEHVAGSESVFTELMNQHAARLGMSGTNFVNSTGLPDGNHYSTARDLAALAKTIIQEFPDYYKMYSIKEYEYNEIKQPNRNSLLWRDDSVDGMKTGRTDDAGYCLVSSAQRNDMRVISVVLGTASEKARIDGSQALINYGFRFFETRLLYRAGEAVTEAKIWKSAKEVTPLGVAEDLYITIPRGTFDDVETVLNMPAVLMAPVAHGQPLAELHVSLDGDDLVDEPLRALDDNPSGNVWQRTRDGIKLWFE